MSDQISFIKAMTTLKTSTENTADFARQLKALSPEDKADFVRLFREAGINVADPAPTPAS